MPMVVGWFRSEVGVGGGSVDETLLVSVVNRRAYGHYLTLHFRCRIICGGCLQAPAGRRHDATEATQFVILRYCTEKE